MKELELKLIVPARKRQRVMKSLQLDTAPSVELEARYFDTPDDKLGHAGLSLRIRREGEAWVQTLKAAADSPARRFEHNVALESNGGPTRPDLSRHRDKSVTKAWREALGGAGGMARLQERHRTCVTRHAMTLELGDEVIEAAFDLGHIESGGHRIPVCELELELKEGASVREMFALANRLVQTHGLWLSTLSKSTRGAALARAQGAPADKATPVHFKPGASSGQQFRAMINNCLAQIMPNASHVAAGHDDADHVHQLRVGIRRLRTVLKEAAAGLEGRQQDWEPVLRKVFRELGAYRDQEEVRKAVEPRLAAVGAPLVAPRTSVGDVPLPQVAVRDAAFQGVLLDLLAFSLEEGRGASGEARRLLRKRIGALHRKVVDDGRRFPELDVERQHRVRKRLKRLRYITELAQPLFSKRAVERYLQHLRPAQDVLGQHNDEAVALQGFRDTASKDGRAWFGVGWLTATQAQSAAQCKKAIKEIQGAAHFW